MPCLCVIPDINVVVFAFPLCVPMNTVHVGPAGEYQTDGQRKS